MMNNSGSSDHPNEEDVAKNSAGISISCHKSSESDIHVMEESAPRSLSLSSERWKLIRSSYISDSKLSTDSSATTVEDQPMTKEIQESDKQDTDTSAQQSTHQYHSQPLENQESMNSSISQADRGSDSFMSLSMIPHHFKRKGFAKVGDAIKAYNQNLCRQLTPDFERVLRSILNFLFRIPLFALYITYILSYFVLITIFVGLIFFAAKLDPTCVRCGSTTMSFGEIDFDRNAAYSCAFLLSWVTFSTVGYGNAWPASISDNAPRGGCYFINFVLFADAFSGIIFVGLCGAILYSRAQKIQSEASVMFCDIMVIRFGSGLYGTGIDYEDDPPAHIQSDGKPIETVHCPILEFRVVNTNGDVSGNEIIDAQIQCISWTSSETVSLGSTREFVRLDSKRRNSLRFSFRKQKDFPCSISQCTIELLNPTHPFFQHIWTAQHVLNASSPLLTNDMKHMIEQHGGRWPRKCNDHRIIRENLCFDEIVVTMNGVYNLSGTQVYGGKTYKPKDVIVGYEFVQAITKGDDGNIVIEADSLHDVAPQKGDDPGEPLGMIKLNVDVEVDG